MDRRRAFLVFGAGQVVALVPQLVLHGRMRGTGGPGIIPFELAGTPERARTMMDRWGPEGRSAARWALILDYPFLVAYTGLNAAAAGAASEALRGRGVPVLGGARRAMEVASVAAGACDSVENAALLGVLRDPDGRLPAVARAFARAKFALLRVVWLYAGLGLAARLAARLR
jgi:hypothetical protein